MFYVMQNVGLDFPRGGAFKQRGFFCTPILRLPGSGSDGCVVLLQCVQSCPRSLLTSRPTGGVQEYGTHDSDADGVLETGGEPSVVVVSRQVEAAASSIHHRPVTTATERQRGVARTFSPTVHSVSFTD
jgi:hypothetical protein